MVILSIVLLAFSFIETLNIILLYKMPGSKMGNAVGVFKAYEKSRQDPEISQFVDYLINWVAGTKLIFVVLLIGIVITGPVETKVFSVIALIFSIATFFTQLYPKLKKIDAEKGIDPAGYSRTLAIMIAGFIAIFAIALAVFFIIR
ncbi:MAG: hypothetical protein JXR86_14030 [Spirochaetales bacterium]|nr:hypothetical protein [Spirochaetales bacterium]